LTGLWVILVLVCLVFLPPVDLRLDLAAPPLDGFLGTAIN